MTFEEMLTEVRDDVRAGVDTETTTRLKRYLNDGQKRILSRTDLTNLRNGTLQFTTEANRSSYGFVQAMRLIDKVTQVSNGSYLRARSIDWLRQMDPGQNASGLPTDWIDMGWQPVFRQPDSTGVWAASSGADTTQVVHLRAVRANGDEQPLSSTTLTGTTRVQLGTLSDLVLIRSLTLDVAAVGNVTFYDAAAAGNELARFPIGVLSNRWKIGRLWPTPSAALEYEVDGQLAIMTMVNDDDVPMLPDDYHDVLPTYARMRWYRWLSDMPRYVTNRDELAARIQELRAYSEFPQGYTPRLAERNYGLRWNNLGGQYPADGWGS